MCGTPFANVLHAFAKRAARSGEQRARRLRRRRKERGRLAGREKAKRETGERAVFHVDPPRRPRGELVD